MASSLAGSENGITHSEEEFEGCKIKVTRGDYGALIGKVAEHLKEAKVVHKISTSYFTSFLKKSICRLLLQTTMKSKCWKTTSRALPLVRWTLIKTDLDSGSRTRAPLLKRMNAYSHLEGFYQFWLRTDTLASLKRTVTLLVCVGNLRDSLQWSTKRCLPSLRSLSRKRKSFFRFCRGHRNLRRIPSSDLTSPRWTFWLSLAVAFQQESIFQTVIIIHIFRPQPFWKSYVEFSLKKTWTCPQINLKNNWTSLLKTKTNEIRSFVGQLKLRSVLAMFQIFIPKN